MRLPACSTEVITVEAMANAGGAIFAAMAEGVRDDIARKTGKL